MSFFPSLGSSLKKSALWLGLVSLLLILPLRFFLPDLKESMIGLLILGVLMFLIAAFSKKESLRFFFRSGQGRHFLYTLVLIFLFLGVLVLANILGLLKSHRFDLTASQEFTLAPQSVKIIRQLPGPVQVLCFFPDDPLYEAPKKKTRDLLESYRYWNEQVTYRFVDPEVDPATAQRYRVKTYGSIVFEGMGKRKTVTEPTEQHFTGALLELSGIRAKKVYFLTGNGEHDPESEEDEGFAEARRGLIRDLYEVGTLDLNTAGKIPEDCSVLIMAGTQKSLSREAVAAVLHFLEGQGKVLLLTDPEPPESIHRLLADYGLTVPKGKILDPGAYVAPDMGIPAVFKGQYPAVVITRGLETTYFPSAAALELTSELFRVQEALRHRGELKAGWPFQPIQYRHLALLPVLVTTPESRLEGGDPGPVSGEGGQKVRAIGAMVVAGGPLDQEQKTPSHHTERLTRLVVIGDSDFASNRHFRNGGNGDLFLNAVNWLAEEEHLISIRPKPYTFRRLLVTPGEFRFIRYSGLFILPFLLLIIAGVIWWRRR